MADLSLVPFDDLVAELKRRVDTLILGVCMISEDAVSKMCVRTDWDGNVLTGIGLARTLVVELETKGIEITAFGIGGTDAD